MVENNIYNVIIVDGALYTHKMTSRKGVKRELKEFTKLFPEGKFKVTIEVAS